MITILNGIYIVPTRIIPDLIIVNCSINVAQVIKMIKNFKQIVNRLTTLYDEREASSIIKMLLEESFGLSFVDVCLGALDRLSGEDKESLEAKIVQLEKGEPVQYVIGHADFYGRKFAVEPGVLIPRPETEELVSWIKEESKGIRGNRNGKKYLLDVGCGSGCISVSLALELPDVDVSAWDISDTALRVTKKNAKALGASVDIYMQDALNAPDGDRDLWNVIVSNPPYICAKEAEDMERNVLEHEPHEALFVPDADPLLFYRAIAEYGTHALCRGGRLYFEINRAYGKDTVDMLKALGYSDIELRKDAFGNDRMVRAVK